MKKKHVLWKLFISTLYLSAFTFGGGYVIVTLMKEKFVDELHWIEEDEMLYLKYRNLTVLQSVLGSLRPAVVAMIASAGLTILMNAFWGGRTVVLANTNYVMVAIFVLSFVLLRKTKLSPIAVMVLAGVLNLAVSLIR